MSSSIFEKCYSALWVLAYVICVYHLGEVMPELGPTYALAFAFIVILGLPTVVHFINKMLSQKEGEEDE